MATDMDIDNRVEGLPVECLARSNWQSTADMTYAFKLALDSGSFHGASLTARMTDIVRKHLLDMWAVSGTAVVDGMPQRSQDSAGMRFMELRDYLSKGSNGSIFHAAFQGPVASGLFLIKFVLFNPSEPQQYPEDVNIFLAEAFVQTLLYCVMEAHGGELPNPIPRVVAPVMMHNQPRPSWFNPLQWFGSGEQAPDPGLLMVNAGAPLGSLIINNEVDFHALFVILALVATHVRNLQALVKFRHADLHCGNVTVAVAQQEYTVQLRADSGDTYPLSTPMVVSLIDFGYTCIQLNDKEVRTAYNTGEFFEQQCNANSDASDMFLLLCSMVLYLNNANSSSQTPFKRFVYGLVKEALADMGMQSGVHYPPLSRWDVERMSSGELHTQAAYARTTTPTHVLRQILVRLRPRQSVRLTGD